VYEPDEHTSQAALIEWRDTLVGPFPELGMLLAIPNGGWRAKQVAKRLKAEGVQPGACDLVLLVPMGEHHGLFVEMKTAAGRATAAQRRFIAAARAHGYRAEVCHSWPEAARLICAYLGLPPDAAPER
jgi:hypothetical protein